MKEKHDNFCSRPNMEKISTKYKNFMLKTSRQHKFLMLYIILIFMFFLLKFIWYVLKNIWLTKQSCVSLSLTTGMRLQSGCQAGREQG